MSCTEDSIVWRLRKKITIQQKERVSDGGGGWTEEWVTFANCYAAVEPLRGRELADHQQMESETTHRIRIRYRAGITAAMRVKFGTRYFRITSPPINENEANRWMQLMCQEVPSDG